MVISAQIDYLICIHLLYKLNYFPISPSLHLNLILYSNVLFLSWKNKGTKVAPICLQAPIKHVFVDVYVYEEQQDPSVWVSKHHFRFLTFNDPSFRAMQKEFKLLAAIYIFNISVFPPYCFSILSLGVNPA